MDLLFSPRDPGNGLYDVPVVCLPKMNAANTQSTDSLWKRFPYGVESREIWAATPATSRLAARLTEDYEYNLGVILALAKHATPSKFFVNLDPRCSEVDYPHSEAPLLETLTNSRLPYQIEFAEDYKFDPSRCGDFTGQLPCWFDVGTNDLYEPRMVLVAPGAIPRSECYDPHTTSTDAQDSVRRRNKLSGLMTRGLAWHTDAICPDYRLVCGSKMPPNLPRSISAYGPEAGTWLQIPDSPCNNYSDVKCAGQSGLDLGILPFPEDPTMSWHHVEDDDEVCKSTRLAEAKSRLGRNSTSVPLPCPGCTQWNLIQKPKAHPPSVDPEVVHPGREWGLFKDLSRGTYSFFLEDKFYSDNVQEIFNARFRSVAPMSNMKLYDHGRLPPRRRPIDTHTEADNGSDPPGSGVTNARSGGGYLSKAAVAAALAITRAIPD